MRLLSMTDGAPWKHILKFSFPVFTGLLLQQLYNTVDTIVVGNFCGDAALSAVGTTASFTLLFLAIATGFSAGNGVVVSQHFGAKNYEAVRKDASTGILFLLLLGVVFSIIGVLIANPAYKYLLAVPDDFLNLTLQYFIVYSLGLVFQYGYNIFSSILRAVGDSAATLYFLLIASIINIVLDIVFVAYFNMGVIGAALATDISQLISFVAAYFYMTKRYEIFRFKISDYKLDLDCINKTVKLGFPIALQLIVVSFGLTLIQRAVNGFGQVMTASFTVGQRIEMYLNLPCNAFQTTLATYTGQNIGARKIDRVKKGAWQTALISLITAIIISITVWLFIPSIIKLFALGPKSAAICKMHLETVVIINILLTVYVPIFGVFQGSNHSIMPALIVVVALFLRVSSTYIFKDGNIFGSSIIWWNGIFGYTAGFTITWSYFLSGKWIKNSNINGF